jgi:hypothetical protein
MAFEDLMGKWSTPFALATCIFGGAAWLTTTQIRLQHLNERVQQTHKELDAFILKSNAREAFQDDRLSRIETKLDILLEYMRDKP